MILNRDKEALLPYEKAAELFDYDPATGIVKWRCSLSNRAVTGKEAGYRNSNGYVYIMVAGVNYAAHRVAWLLHHGEWPTHEIDHVKGKRADNRISKMRDVTHVLNSRNASTPINNSSGIMGVSWDRQRAKWKAVIKVNYIQIYLGRYLHIFDAVCARKSAEAKYAFHKNHGKFSQ